MKYPINKENLQDPFSIDGSILRHSYTRKDFSLRKPRPQQSFGLKTLWNLVQVFKIKSEKHQKTILIKQSSSKFLWKLKVVRVLEVNNLRVLQRHCLDNWSPCENTILWQGLSQYFQIQFQSVAIQYCRKYLPGLYYFVSNIHGQSLYKYK